MATPHPHSESLSEEDRDRIRRWLTVLEGRVSEKDYHGLVRLLTHLTGYGLIASNPWLVNQSESLEWLVSNLSDGLTYRADDPAKEQAYTLISDAIRLFSRMVSGEAGLEPEGNLIRFRGTQLQLEKLTRLGVARRRAFLEDE